MEERKTMINSQMQTMVALLLEVVVMNELVITEFSLGNTVLKYYLRTKQTQN